MISAFLGFGKGRENQRRNLGNFASIKCKKKTWLVSHIQDYIHRHRSRHQLKELSWIVFSPYIIVAGLFLKKTSTYQLPSPPLHWHHWHDVWNVTTISPQKKNFHLTYESSIYCLYFMELSAELLNDFDPQKSQTLKPYKLSCIMPTHGQSITIIVRAY